MTLKQTITREVLESVEDPAGPRDVLNRYSRSKGPLYLALAEATNQLQRRVSAASLEMATVESRRDELQVRLEAVYQERQELEEKVQLLGHQVKQAEVKLNDVGGLLDRATDLNRLGFGEKQLARLQELLGNIAADHGVPIEEGVTQFFETMDRYERVVS